MRPTLNRRTFMKASGVATIAGITTLMGSSCSGNDGGSEGSPTTNLRFEWNGPQDRTKRFTKVVNLYEKRNPSVKIEPEFGDLTSVTTRVSTEIAGGNAPDVFWALGDMPTYIDHGLILDLDPYIGKQLKLAGFPKALLTPGQVGNKQYQVPHGIQSSCIFSNQTVLKSLKIDVPDVRGTYDWDEFKQICEEIHAKKGARFWGTDDPTINGIDDPLWIWARERGEDSYTNDGDIAFSEDTLASWWTYWQKMRNSGACVPPKVELSDETSFQGSAMIRGLAAFHIRHSNQMLDLQALTKDPLAMHPYPAPSGVTLKQSSRVTGNMICVSSRTKDKDAAVKFLNFLLNDPERAKIVATTIGAPPTEAIRKVIEPIVTDPERQFLDFIDYEISLAPKPAPNSPAGADQFFDALTRASEQIAYGKSSIGNAVKQIFGPARTTLRQANDK